MSTATVTELNTGQAIPVLGLGTFQATKPGEVYAAVMTAVRDAGYRLIDCAASYGNQEEVGAAIKSLIADGIVAREDLFIVSKLFQTHHDWEGRSCSSITFTSYSRSSPFCRCYEALDQTLKELGLEYLDLYLMHWPFAFEQKSMVKNGKKLPLRMEDGSPNPIWNVKMEYIQTWKAMESMVSLSGRGVRAIGVSNFTAEQIEHLLSQCTIRPAVNQVEFHPYLYQQQLLEYCTNKSIRIMAYSPLGSSSDRVPPSHRATLLNHPIVKGIADSIQKTPGQVLIRWSLQKGLISIPKSSNSNRIRQNIDTIHWRLDNQQIRQLDELHCKFRYFSSYLKRPDNNIVWHDGKIQEM